MLNAIYEKWVNGKKVEVNQSLGKVNTMNTISDNVTKSLIKSQKERCLDYLKKHQKINPLQAWQALGIYRLSAVILDLRAEGHIITTVKTPVQNQFGESCNVATYVLEND